MLAMELSLQTSRLLHDEHMTVRTILSRLRNVLTSYGTTKFPDAHEPTVAALMSDLELCLASSLPRHFDFEEDAVVPLLVEAGESSIVDLLNDEPREIRPLLEPLRATLREANSVGFSSANWSEARRLGIELETRLTSHIDKEETGLMSAIEDSIDEATDVALTSKLES